MEEILDKFNNVDNPILAIFICHMTYVSFLQGFPSVATTSYKFILLAHHLQFASTDET